MLSAIGYFVNYIKYIYFLSVIFPKFLFQNFIYIYIYIVDMLLESNKLAFFFVKVSTQIFRKTPWCTEYFIKCREMVSLKEKI